MKVVVDNSILKFKELIPHLSDLKDIDFSEKILYFQEYIGNLNEKIFSDMRVIVSKHKTVCAIKRVSKNPITNVALGGKVKKLKYYES